MSCKSQAARDVNDRAATGELDVIAKRCLVSANDEHMKEETEDMKGDCITGKALKSIWQGAGNEVQHQFWAARLEQGTPKDACIGLFLLDGLSFQLIFCTESRIKISKMGCMKLTLK